MAGWLVFFPGGGLQAVKARSPPRGMTPLTCRATIPPS